MKKDIEWLKEEIKGYAHANYGNRMKVDISEEELDSLINQLDEPETLSAYWIEQKSIDTHVDTLTGEVQMTYRLDDLENLLVPDLEEVDRAYRKGFKEGERQTAEYFESITEEPSKEQVWKYLSEHGIEVVDKEPETVADVVADFFKSLERLKEVLGTEVKELEE